jgi:hypothetical protein
VKLLVDEVYPGVHRRERGLPPDCVPGVYNVVFYDPTGAYVTQWCTGAAYVALATSVSVDTGGPATGIDAVLAGA